MPHSGHPGILNNIFKVERYLSQLWMHFSNYPRWLTECAPRYNVKVNEFLARRPSWHDMTTKSKIVVGTSNEGKLFIQAEQASYPLLTVTFDEKFLVKSEKQTRDIIPQHLNKSRIELFISQ